MHVNFSAVNLSKVKIHDFLDSYIFNKYGNDESICSPILIACFTDPRFDLTFRDSYFTIQAEVFTNHILSENNYFKNHIEQTEHKIMVLKPVNK